MNIQQPTHIRRNTRVFDRIKVDGSLRFKKIDYPINDLSVGGVSVIGAVLDWEEGDIRRAHFTMRHGELEVSGKVNCQCLKNGENGITRFKLVNPSEDQAEFFRAATLRSSKGADYGIGWLAESSFKLEEAETKPRRPLTSYFLSMPMLVLAMFLLLLGTFIARKTDGDAYWVTETHEIVAPVTGRIHSLETGPFAVGDPISEIAAKTVNGEDMLIAMRADVASLSIDWHFSTGDRVAADEVLGILHNVPRNQGRYHAIVSLEIPFFNLRPGQNIVLQSVGGKRVVGELKRMLTPRQVLRYARHNDQFAPNKTYALVILDEAAVDLSGSPEVRILDTFLENTFR